MAKGVIYVMTTVVPGLVKLGKTGTENFSSRMYNLERNGYSNVVGLKRKFAIEVEDYDDKEKMLDEIFSKSKVPNTELFALDIDLVIQLLSSFEGRQIYPKEKTKEEVFDEAVKESAAKLKTGCIPDGLYYMTRNVKEFGEVKGKAFVKDGVFTVLKGSICADSTNEYALKIRSTAKIENGILTENYVCKSPSTASSLLIGKSSNGWTTWVDESGRNISRFRKDV